MGKVASHEQRVDHVVPAEALHDGPHWAGLEVLGGGAGQVRGQQGEA